MLQIDFFTKLVFKAFLLFNKQLIFSSEYKNKGLDFKRAPWQIFNSRTETELGFIFLIFFMILMSSVALLYFIHLFFFHIYLAIKKKSTYTYLKEKNRKIAPERKQSIRNEGVDNSGVFWELN